MNERIKQLREELGYTQEQLALHCGVKVETVKGWEKGNVPTLYNVIRLSIALGTTMDYLVKGVVL